MNTIQQAILEKLEAKVSKGETTFTQFYKETGISQPALHRYRKGERTMDLNVYVKIQNFLK